MNKYFSRWGVTEGPAFVSGSLSEIGYYQCSNCEIRGGGVELEKA